LRRLLNNRSWPLANAFRRWWISDFKWWVIRWWIFGTLIFISILLLLDLYLFFLVGFWSLFQISRLLSRKKRKTSMEKKTWKNGAWGEKRREKKVWKKARGATKRREGAKIRLSRKEYNRSPMNYDQCEPGLNTEMWNCNEIERSFDFWNIANYKRNKPCM
jgi:hypothetical protein